MTLGDIKRGSELGLKDTHKCILIACVDCGDERWVKIKKGKPESLRCRECASKIRAMAHIGVKSAWWKGGRKKDKHGYIQVRIYPDAFFYPMAKASGYVFEHRLMVAKAIGRNLQRWEVVHHKRGFAKDDNRYPETLQLVTDDRHNQITLLENEITFLKKRVTMLEAEVILLRKAQGVLK